MLCRPSPLVAHVARAESRDGESAEASAAAAAGPGRPPQPPPPAAPPSTIAFSPQAALRSARRLRRRRLAVRAPASSLALSAPAAPVNPLAQPARGSVVVTSTVRGLRTLFLASRSQQRERTWERWERISLYPLLLVAAPLVYLEFASTSDRHRASLASKGSLLGAILPASVSDLLGLRRAPAEEGEAGRAR